MNCFCTSKVEAKADDEEVVKTEQPNRTNGTTQNTHLYKKKGESSTSGSSAATGTKKISRIDGLGHSKKTDKGKPDQKKTFCWKRTESTEDEKSEPSVVYGTTIKNVAYMPVSKNDPFYNMNHSRRGRAVIFNFDHWDNTSIPELDLRPRRGSQKDKKDLSACLENLDFEVTAHDNCSNRQFWNILDDLQQEDHSDADCLVIAIFTHGERNTVIVRDGCQIPVNLIWEHFEAHNCPSLAGKPKIFIIQACRGRKYDSGTTLAPGGIRSAAEQKKADETDSATFSYVIPNAADILVAFSCPLGHYAWRHPERGSWFIQSICKIFNESAYEMDLQSLFTTVAREVALNFLSNTPDELETHEKKQVTSTCSTLIRHVCFTPKQQKDQIDNDNVEVEEAQIQPSSVAPFNSTVIPVETIELPYNNGNVSPKTIDQIQDKLKLLTTSAEIDSSENTHL